MKISSLLSSVRVLAFGTLLIVTNACSVSEQVKESPSGKAASSEARENQAYELVQYRLNFMDEARLGGQDILFMRQSTDLTSAQQAKLQTALQAGTLPLRLLMRLYARNASKENIKLQKLDYQLLLDGRELTAGSTGANIELELRAIETLPVAVDLNVPADRVAGSTPAAFAVNLADFTGTTRRLTMRIRPTYVGAGGRISQPTNFQSIELVTAKRTAKQ